MPAERPSYPFIPGDRGIALFDFMAQQGGEFVVSGGSGKELNCTFGERLMRIEDAENPRFCLSADVDSLGGLHLDLYPRLRHKGERHPDLYAKIFITLALGYFQKKGIEIKYFFASWEKGGTNYEEFMEVYDKEKGNEKEAAAQTWSARVMEKHGFTKVETVGIAEEEDKVVAWFSRTPSKQ